MGSTLRRSFQTATGAGAIACALVFTDVHAASSGGFLRPQSNPPVLPGDVFTYVERITDTSVIPGQKPQVSVTNEKLKITATGNATFNGRKNLTQLAYQFSTLGATVDEFVGFSAVGGVTAELLYGESAAEKTTTSQSVTTVTIPKGEILDVFPEAKGQSWNPAVTSTIVAEGKSSSVTDKLLETDYYDGSYTRTSTLALSGGYSQTDTETLASNGSGKTTSAETGSNDGSVVYGLPVAVNGAHAIPVTTAGGNPLPGKPTPPKTVGVVDWYPSHDLPTSPLASAVVTDKGTVTTPSGCGPRAGLKTNDLHGTASGLDPINGSIDTTTIDEYDLAGYGTVCSIETDVSQSYDNTPASPDGKLSSTDTLVTAMALTAESGPKPLFAGAAQPFLIDLVRPYRFARGRELHKRHR